MNHPRLVSTTAFAPLFLAGQLAGYGPPVDHTRFVSAKQNESGAVLYTLQEVVYRPAAGLAAYPDGGIPQYVVDRNVIGLIDAAGASRTLHIAENTRWQHGQGQFAIAGFKGTTAVVAEGGQRRDDYLTDSHFYLVDISTAQVAEFPLKEDLAARGRRLGYSYLLDQNGTLLLMTWPSGNRRTDATSDNEIWLRKPSGEYVLVAKAADLYEQLQGKLVYWELNTRTLFEYEVATGRAHAIRRHTPAPEVRPDTEVRVSSDGTALERWKRSGSAWRYDRPILKLEEARTVRTPN